MTPLEPKPPDPWPLSLSWTLPCPFLRIFWPNLPDFTASFPCPDSSLRASDTRFGRSRLGWGTLFKRTSRSALHLRLRVTRVGQKVPFFQKIQLCSVSSSIAILRQETQISILNHSSLFLQSFLYSYLLELVVAQMNDEDGLLFTFGWVNEATTSIVMRLTIDYYFYVFAFNVFSCNLHDLDFPSVKFSNCYMIFHYLIHAFLCLCCGPSLIELNALFLCQRITRNCQNLSSCYHSFDLVNPTSLCWVGWGFCLSTMKLLWGLSADCFNYRSIGFSCCIFCFCWFRVVWVLVFVSIYWHTRSVWRINVNFPSAVLGKGCRACLVLKVGGVAPSRGEEQPGYTGLWCCPPFLFWSVMQCYRLEHYKPPCVSTFIAVSSCSFWIIVNCEIDVLVREEHCGFISPLYFQGLCIECLRARTGCVLLSLTMIILWTRLNVCNGYSLTMWIRIWGDLFCCSSRYKKGCVPGCVLYRSVAPCRGEQPWIWTPRRCLLWPNWSMMSSAMSETCFYDLQYFPHCLGLSFDESVGQRCFLSSATFHQKEIEKYFILECFNCWCEAHSIQIASGRSILLLVIVLICNCKLFYWIFCVSGLMSLIWLLLCLASEDRRGCISFRNSKALFQTAFGLRLQLLWLRFICWAFSTEPSPSKIFLR